MNHQPRPELPAPFFTALLGAHFLLAGITTAAVLAAALAILS